MASLDAAGHGNWQGAVKAGNHWFIAQAGAGDKFQVFHRLDGSGKALDQMKVVGAAHTTSFAVVGNTVYATNDGEVVTFPYQPGATIDASDSTPTGWKGYISIDPTERFAVIRKGNHYRAYDLETREPVGKEVITPTGQRQGFSIVGDALYVLTGKTNQPGRVDSFSFTTGEQTGTQDVTGVGPGRHREPEGMYGDLMGVKTGLGSARRLKIYQLDTGIAPATEAPPVTDPPSAGAPADAGAAEAPGPTTELDQGADDHGDGVDPGGGDTGQRHDAGDDGDHVTFGGKTVDRRTASMLAEAERLANVEDPSIGRFNLTQGSFSHSVRPPAGPTTGRGLSTCTPASYSAAQKETIGLALRQVGFASWLRRESQGPWDEHWHGIAMGTKGLPSGGAARSELPGRPERVAGERQGHRSAAGGDQDLGGVPAGAAGAPIVRPHRRWKPVQPGATGHRTEETEFGIAGGHSRSRSGLGCRRTDRRVRTAGQTDWLGPTPTGTGCSTATRWVPRGCDPLLIDSDLDGFTDAAELRFGGDPLGRIRAERRARPHRSARTRWARTRWAPTRSVRAVAARPGDPWMPDPSGRPGMGP